MQESLADMSELSSLRQQLHELWPRRNEPAIARRIDAIARQIHAIQVEALNAN